MTLEQLIQPESVLCNASARSKKHCLEILSELLAQTNSEISHEEIFAKLIERERLGCTSLEKGIAFPHCRVAGVQMSRGALIKLAEPVEFDSPDGAAVDIVFGMMVPAEIDQSHYADIELVTSLLRQEPISALLRQASTSKELYVALMQAACDGATPLQNARNA